MCRMGQLWKRRSSCGANKRHVKHPQMRDLLEWMMPPSWRLFVHAKKQQRPPPQQLPRVAHCLRLRRDPRLPHHIGMTVMMMTTGQPSAHAKKRRRHTKRRRETEMIEDGDHGHTPRRRLLQRRMV
jgi:hypothetical protein